MMHFHLKMIRFFRDNVYIILQGWYPNAELAYPTLGPTFSGRSWSWFATWKTPEGEQLDPENSLLEKENHLNQTMIFRLDSLIFGGSGPFCCFFMYIFSRGGHICRIIPPMKDPCRTDWMVQDDLTRKKPQPRGRGVGGGVGGKNGWASVEMGKEETMMKWMELEIDGIFEWFP